MKVAKILLPQLGESVVEGTLTSWMVKEGDVIEKYQPIAEVVTDKVVTEIPSSYAGTVTELLVNLDEPIPVGTEIMAIQTDEPLEPTEEKEEVVETPAVAEDPAPSQSIKSSGSARLSPAVLTLSEELGIDINDVVGTGRDGRITRKDVRDYAKNPPKKKAQATPKPTTTTPAPAPTPRIISGKDTVITPSPVRKAIARKMVQSKTEIPHAWMVSEADVTELVKLRNMHKNAFKQAEGYSLSYLAFFVKAVATGLAEFPELNASWVDDKIIMHGDINISIAVSYNDLLYVPVIRNVDTLSIKGIAKEIARLSDGIRNNTITQEDMVGGSFTVNSTGSFGSVLSMGIINHPQVAIMQVESIKKRVVYRDESIQVRDMVNLCVSIDHRAIDGSIAGRFMKRVVELLESTDINDAI